MKTNISKWDLSTEEKSNLIASLTDKVAALRTQADISQEELANIVGISRQTYSNIETKKREMAWSTYLSLVFFFDANNKTTQMIRDIGAYPSQLVDRFNI